jgi:hypothetical protein
MKRRPLKCARCGVSRPMLFIVPDRVWKRRQSAMLWRTLCSFFDVATEICAAVPSNGTALEHHRTRLNHLKLVSEDRLEIYR